MHLEPNGDNILNMEITTTNKQVVDEFSWGVYVWEIEEDGETKILGDNGDFMLVRCTGSNHAECRKLIAEAAAHYGYPEGRPVFWSGVRPISDEEYEQQLERAKQGLTPDPFDIGAIQDELRGLK